MHFTSQKILALALVASATFSVSPSARAQDPVDQQVSPEVRALQQQGAKEEVASRHDPVASPEVQSLNAAGAKEDGSAWHNLESFIQQKTKDGLRGKALADAVRGERQRLGLMDLTTAMGKKMREYERAQERIEVIDQKLGGARTRLNDNDPYSAGSIASSDSNVRSGIEKNQKQLQDEKEQLEKRSAAILEDLSSSAKF